MKKTRRLKLSSRTAGRGCSDKYLDNEEVVFVFVLGIDKPRVKIGGSIISELISQQVPRGHNS